MSGSICRRTRIVPVGLEDTDGRMIVTHDRDGAAEADGDIVALDDFEKLAIEGDKGVGEFMKKKVFEPGRTLSWNALTKFATGEELNAKAFAADFRGK